MGDWIGRATTKGLGIVTVCTSILLAYVCIAVAVPCKFWNICHHATYLLGILIYVAVCPTILLPFVCIAIPCKFLKICHHATILSFRLSYMLLCVLLSHFLQHTTYLCITESYILLCVLLSYRHLCLLLSPASFGKPATMPPTYLLGSLICCYMSWYVIAFKF